MLVSVCSIISISIFKRLKISKHAKTNDQSYQKKSNRNINYSIIIIIIIVIIIIIIHHSFINNTSAFFNYSTN